MHDTANVPDGYRHAGDRGARISVVLPKRWQVGHLFAASFLFFVMMAVAFDRLGFKGSIQNLLLLVVVALAYCGYRFQPQRVLTVADDTLTFHVGKRVVWQGPIRDVECTVGGARGQGKARSFFYRTFRIVMGTSTFHLTLVGQASKNKGGPTFPLGELFGAEDEAHVETLTRLLLPQRPET